MVEAFSVLPIFLVIVCIEVRKGGNSGRDLTSRKLPGRVVSLTPLRETNNDGGPTAKSTCSPKIGMDRRVINKGATKRWLLLAYGMAATAMNSVKFAAKSINPPPISASLDA